MVHVLPNGYVYDERNVISLFLALFTQHPLPIFKKSHYFQRVKNRIQYGCQRSLPKFKLTTKSSEIHQC